MKEILHNDNNLKESDINKLVCRAKVLIINSNDEILLAYSDNNYQFPGGHLEENETFDECVVRELEEETGIVLPFENRNPFLSITYLNKDYPNIGQNSKSIANYYAVKTDLKPNLDKVTLTEREKDGNFELKYIHKDKIISELENSLEHCHRKNVVLDTLEAIKEYLNNN